MANHFTLRAVDEETEIPLDKEVVVLGRDSTCDAVIDREEVSRHHAKLKVGRDGITIQDLGSTNGTSVNKHRILGETRINPGDVLKLVKTAFYLLAPRVPDATVPEANLATILSEGNESFVMEMFSHGDKTVSYEKFPMPAGWSTYGEGNGRSTSTAEDSTAEKVDELLAKQLSIDSEFSAALVVITGKQESHVMPLSVTGDRQSWIIGRDNAAHLRFTDLSISSRHAEITYDSGTWRISDKDSTNGVKVNGKREKSSLLRDRDSIGLGGISMVFCTRGGS